MKAYYLFKLLLWITGTYMFYITKNWTTALYILIGEIALIVTSFDKILIDKKGKFILEKIKNEVYKSVIADFSEILSYLLVRTGKLTTSNSPKEIVSMRDKLINTVRKSEVDKEMISKIDKSLTEDIHSKYQFLIMSELNRLLYIILGVHRLSASEIQEEVQTMLREQKTNKIMIFLKENINLPNQEEEFRKIRNLIEEYRSFISEEETV